MKLKIDLTKDEYDLVCRAFEHLRPAQKGGGPGERVEFVLMKLLEQWDLTQDDTPEPKPTAHASGVDAILKGITDPDISLEVKVRHDKVTPRATDGLVPWEYIIAGYPKLEFVAAVVTDYTNKGEQRVAVIRQVLTRIPEDQWESEQTRSIMTKALLEVRGA